MSEQRKCICAGGSTEQFCTSTNCPPPTQRCWCGAVVYNGHHCENGHLQHRVELRDSSEGAQQVLGVVLLVLILFGGAIADLLA